MMTEVARIATEDGDAERETDRQREWCDLPASQSGASLGLTWLPTVASIHPSTSPHNGMTNEGLRQNMCNFSHPEIPSYLLIVKLF